MTGESVLILEEDGIIAFHLQETLKKAGYAVEEPSISDGEALARLRNPPLPDLVLIDAGIPGRSPITEEVHRICSQSGVTAVTLTSFSDPLANRLADRRPCGITLVKPFTDSDLLRAVAEALRAGPECNEARRTGNSA
ncbi:MAG TPA: hypothetical protein VLY83_02850 [Methanoregula sp.]|nr:hypothetical protein [Methanoregula sp.]